MANSHRHSNQLSREQLYRENERLLRENEELRRKVAERESQIAEHEKQIADAEKQIADAEKQIADLERQLAGRKKNSTNSSKPPSSDGPSAVSEVNRHETCIGSGLMCGAGSLSIQRLEGSRPRLRRTRALWDLNRIWRSPASGGYGF